MRWASRDAIRPGAVLSIGRCVTASRRSASASRPCGRPAATAFCSCPSIRNIAPPPTRQRALRAAAPYFDDPVYTGAVAQSIRAGLGAIDFEPEIILASFHGIPRVYFDKGDPYYCHCAKTWRLAREALGFSAERFQLTFQSRFGPTEYLQPYTDMTVKALAARGVKRLAIVTPGFAADCLETIEEIGVENADYFREGGG